MSNLHTEKIDIYISVDVKTINAYFNPHDPSPIYKRQINQRFEKYIFNAVRSSKRYSAIFYKLNYTGVINKQYAEPLMHAVHRHFSIKKTICENDFKKFKRRNFFLLAISVCLVITLEAFLPLVIKNFAEDIYNGLKNCLDVFSWVILWKPIYDLLFAWNPHLKEILLLKKLSTAEIIFETDKKNIEPDIQKLRAFDDEVEMSDSFTLEDLLSN